MKALVGAFNQEKELVGAFSVIVLPVVEPMDRFTSALLLTRVSGVGGGQRVLLFTQQVQAGAAPGWGHTP